MKCFEISTRGNITTCVVNIYVVQWDMAITTLGNIKMQKEAFWESIGKMC